MTNFPGISQRPIFPSTHSPTSKRIHRRPDDHQRAPGEVDRPVEAQPFTAEDPRSGGEVVMIAGALGEILPDVILPGRRVDDVRRIVVIPQSQRKARPFPVGAEHVLQADAEFQLVGEDKVRLSVRISASGRAVILDQVAQMSPVRQKLAVNDIDQIEVQIQLPGRLVGDAQAVGVGNVVNQR